MPIDDINPLISVTADYGIIAEDRPRNQFTYGVLEVPDGNGGFVESDRAPIGTYLYNLVATPPDLVSLIGLSGKGNDSTPTFEWDFLVPDEQITEVNLFISTFAKGEGLLPWDELVDLSDSSFLPQFTEREKRELLTKRWNGYDDFNPGRILTATWKKDTDKWYDRDGTELVAGNDDPRNTSTRLTLNDVLTLTAGQDYNWAVQAVRANGETNIDFDSFRTTSGLTDNPFSSVSILTHGFTILPTATGVPNDFFELADSIASVNGEAPNEKGLILLYDKPTGLWTPVDGKGKKINELTDNLNPGDENYLTILADNIRSKYVNQNKSLVLLPEWSTKNESIIETSGFTEGAADAIFASIVQLDQALGGDVGEKDSTGKLIKLYDENGDLIRKHGDIFNSALHFIGFSRGTVVTSEIIQRLGTYFPYAGGPINADGTPVMKNGKQVRDLQMTTIDPHDFYQESLKVDLIIPGTPKIKDFRDFDEPTVEVWENVTFADNYYQTVANPKGSTWTPNGRYVADADVNIKLDGRTGFTNDDGRGGPHGNVFSWYAGTLDLNIDRVDNGYTINKVGNSYRQEARPVYDQLGEESLRDLLSPKTITTLLKPWYLPSDGKGSTEGIGSGWYYSALASGKRPDVDLSQRKSVSYDNTDDDIVKGDFAVPTIFNGNFDVGVSDDPNAPVPGWSFHNGGQPLLRKHLVDVSTIPTLVEPVNEFSSEDDFDGLSAALSIEERKNNARQLGGQFLPTYDKRMHAHTWGVFRFDLHAPIDIESDQENFGDLIVRIEDASNPDNNFHTQVIQLEDARNTTSRYTQRRVDGVPTKVTIPSSYEDDIYRLGYAVEGFETFHINVPPELRGRIVNISFQLNNATTPVWIDNTWFRSEALKWGNPTNARNGSGADPNNYLIEKPQYSLSYNQSKRTANWVAWKVNKSWIEGRSSRPGGFATDPALELAADEGINFTTVTNAHYESNYLATANGSIIQNWEEEGTYQGTDPQNPRVNIFVRNDDNTISGYNEQGNFIKKYKLDSNKNSVGKIYLKDVQGNKQYYIWDDTQFPNPDDRLYSPEELSRIKPREIIPIPIFKTDRGHLAPSADRIRHRKDQIATFLTSNLIPQDSINNRGLWKQLETYIQTISKTQTDIDNYIIAGTDDVNQNYPAISSNTGFNPSITVPRGIWKVVVSEKRQDNNNSPSAASFGFYIGNDLRKGRKWDNYISSIGVLEGQLRSTNRNSSNGNIFHPVYDFLNDLPSETINELELKNKIKIPRTTSSLLAEKPLFSEKTNFTEVGIAEVGSSVLAANESRLPQLSFSPDSITEVAANEVTSYSIVNPGEVGASEVNIFPNSNMPRRISKINSSQNSTTKISPEFGIFEINTTEVNPYEQPVINIKYSESGKISLPSIVSAQEFSNINLFSFDFHSLTPLFDNIYSTVNTKQNRLLDPLNLTLEITDLPTGQLAEAQVTEFTDQGIPNGGKILIDHNANGLGWFIDPTPLDHSEFTQTITDTALLATADSVAHGKYDLLTTILHEMSHLAGFISGYTEFDRHIQTINGKKTFVGDNFTATLTPDGSHLDPTVHPYDLLNNTLKPGIRKLPSLLDLQILNTVRFGDGEMGRKNLQLHL